MLRLSTLNSNERRIQRLIVGHAMECHPDKVGRILIPNSLRQYAKLTKKIIWVGQLNKCELWDESIWHEQIKQDLTKAPSDIEQLSDKLKKISILRWNFNDSRAQSGSFT